LFIQLELLVQLPHVIPLCGRKEWNFDELLEGIWSYAMMIRIYTKPKGQIPDYSAPIVLHAKRPTITQFTNRIHRGLMAQFKYAWVWGMSVKHQPQKVGREHNLADEDVVQIVKKV
jgi:ribosome-interacting GTPase 1